MALIEELWNSIAEEDPEALAPSQEQRDEVDRRIAEHERDPASAVRWEEVRERLRARHG